MPTQLLALRKRMRVMLVVLSAVALVTGNLLSVYAADLTTSSLELGDPRTGATTSYTFNASGFSGTALRCMTLELDSQADGAGGVPTGLSTTSEPATLSSSSLLTVGDWTQDNTTNGTLKITHATGAAPAASGNIVWGNVVNGSTEATTYYGIFNTYSDAGCSAVVDTVVVAFIYNDGELVTLTIDPTLTFSINTVASGTTINGTDTTVDSGASSIDFGSNVTSVANGVSGHRLDVTSNATGGYNVYIRHTDDLTNAASDTITTHTGTNAVPSAFPAAGTEAWGYTTEDADLAQFNGGLWAGFTTSNELVMTNANATAGVDQVLVGHQVGVANTTEAGTYTSTLIYTIVATY